MFEVIRYRFRGEFTYHCAIIPYGSVFSPKGKRDSTPVIHRFGPFSSEEDAKDFIEEIEKDALDAPFGLQV
jgi:hypothetical protein